MGKSLEEIIKEQNEAYENLSPKKKKALNEFVKSFFLEENEEE